MAGEALIHFPKSCMQNVLKYPICACSEREQKERTSVWVWDKDSCHVLVFVSKTLSELCRGETEESALPPFILNNHLSKHPQTDLTICTQNS